MHELEVQAPEGSTVNELSTAIARHFSRAGDHQILRGAELLPGSTRLGVAPLVDGASVTCRPSSSAPTPTPRRRSLPVSPVGVAVAHGPDAGWWLELLPGPHTVGRSREADTLLADPALSRVHLEIRCGSDGLQVRDLASTNGTRMDGRSVGSTEVRWPPGAAVTAGDTELVARGASGLPATSAARRDGTQHVNRRPRVAQPQRHQTATLPPHPQRQAATRVPWVAIALPVPIAVVMAFFLGPAMLAFTLVSPLAMVGNLLNDRIQGRRRYAAQLAQHNRSTADVLASIGAACARERAARQRDHPDPAEILEIATTPSVRLWERRRDDPDALAVAIGTCTSPARLLTVRAASGEVREPPGISGAPCVVPLAEVGVLGMCGERSAVLGAVRSVVGQLLALHSPVDLRVVLLCAQDSGDDWRWLDRVPHVRAPSGDSDHGTAVLARDNGRAEALVDDLVRQVEENSNPVGGGPSRWAGPRTVLVLDGAADLRAIPGLTRVLAAGQAAGISTIALDRKSGALPIESGALVDLSTPGTPSLNLPGHDHGELTVDLVGDWWADRLSRGLAPLRDAAPAESDAWLPPSVRLDELLPSPTTPAAVVDLWRRGPTTAVPLGVTARGPWVLDLATDGPHLLVAGTTGAGKSELLRTLVVALALHNRPDDLAFVLVDYKGGAAFGDCGRLPHTAGLVTDLDDHRALRALASLHAEIRRRERILRSAGVSDFSAYQGLSRPGPSLPRLLIVIDEFRALADELPTFVHGMVRVAALGRSLGVHLVLATQRPAGVVTGDIKANVNLRIALRVRDRSDSEDVIEVANAANIGPTTPGRGYARAGGATLTTFQAARVLAPSQVAGVRIRELRWGEAPGEWTSTTEGGRPRDELARLVEVVRRASAEVGAVPSPPAWLPPLPEAVPLASLPAVSDPDCCSIGLIDLPDRQAQEPLQFKAEGGGHWAFVGTSGSGRTTALLTLAHALAGQRGPTRLHLYAVSSGSLASLTKLAHCGAHVTSDDLPRLERLVGRLEQEVRARRHGAESRAALLLLIDDWDILATRPASVEHAHLVDRVLGLLREGTSYGLTAALAGDRSLLVGRVGSIVSQRVLLRLADRTDAALAGISPAAAPIDAPPGRGVLADGAHVQLALWLGGPVVSTAIPGEALPPRVDPLPLRVSLTDLVLDLGPGAIAVGVGGDELASVGLHPSIDGRRWLVAGASGSGVSTTLLLLGRQLIAQQRPVAVVSRRAGPLDVLRQDGRLRAWCDSDSRASLDETRRRCPGLAVLVDHADELVDSAIEAALRDFGRSVDHQGGLLAVGANSSTLAAQYRGLGTYVARERSGVLLGARAPVDADPFGLRLRIEPHAPPGRGYLVRRGVSAPVQVAFPGVPTAG